MLEAIKERQSLTLVYHFSRKYNINKKFDISNIHHHTAVNEYFTYIGVTLVECMSHVWSEYTSLSQISIS